MAATNGDVVTGEAHRAAIAALESEMEAQRAEIDHLNSVVDEFADVKDTARALLNHVSEQKEEKEQLQSELDRVGKEMADSLEDANEEYMKCHRDLLEKEGMLSELRDKYDDLVDHLESEKSINSAQTEELRRLEAAGSQDIDRLKKELAIVQNDAQATIDNFTNEVEMMGQEVAKERKLREEAENEVVRLSQGISNREEKDQEKDRELERLRARVEENKAIDRELERLKADKEKMQAELEKSAGEITQLRRLRGESLRGKSELECEMQQLNVQVEEYKAAKDGAAEKNAKLQSDYELLTNAMDEASRRISGWESEVDRLNRDMADAAKEAETAMEEKDRELRKLNSQMEEFKTARDGEAEQMKKLQSEVEGLNAEVEEYKSAVDQEMELNRTLQSDLEQATRGRGETSGLGEEEAGAAAPLRGKVELESKIDELNRVIVVAEEKAKVLEGQIERLEAAAQDKDRELQERNNQTDQYKTAKDDEAKKSKRLESEIDELNRAIVAAVENADGMEGKIDRLNRDVVLAREEAEAAMQEKDRAFRQLNSQIEEYRAAADDGSESNTIMQLEIDLVTGERDDALQANSELKRKVDRLGDCLAVAEKTADAMLHDKNKELQRLNDRVGEWKESSRALQLDLESATRERDAAFQRNSELKRKIDQFSKDTSGTEKNLATMAEEKDRINAEVGLSRKLSLQLERVARERDESLRRNSELESRVNRLDRDMIAFVETADAVMKEKDRALRQLSIRLKEFQAVAKSRAANDTRDTSIDGDGGGHRSNGTDTTSQHSDLTSVASDGAKSDTRPKKIDETNGRSPGRSRGRLGTILSRFGSQRSATESDAKSRDIPEGTVRDGSATGSDAKSREIPEGTVREPDRTTNEPEAVISPNIAIVERIKR